MQSVCDSIAIDVTRHGDQNIELDQARWGTRAGCCVHAHASHVI